MILIIKNKKGFTLIELIVVIAIIGIIAVIALPALFSNIKKAKIAELHSDYSAFKSAALSIYAEGNTLEGQDGDGDNGEIGKLDNLKDFMETMPENSPLGGKYRLHINGGGNLDKFSYPSNNKVDLTTSLDTNYNSWENKLNEKWSISLKIVDVPKTLSSKDFQRIIEPFGIGDVGLFEEAGEWDIVFKLIE